jgi:hypothetical protein
VAGELLFRVPYPNRQRRICIRPACPASPSQRHEQAKVPHAVLTESPSEVRPMNASPAARTRSATSSGGRLIYSSWGGLSLSFSESSGLAVAFRRRSELPERKKTHAKNVGLFNFSSDKKLFYCRASIKRVIVRFNSLSERRNSSILLMECSTVV